VCLIETVHCPGGDQGVRYAISPTASAVCFPGRGPTLSAQRVVSIIPRSRPDLPADGVPEVHLRVDVSLVLIPIYATSPRGSSVTDLIKDNFRLYEDRVEQNSHAS